MSQTNWGASPDDWFVLGTLADLCPDLLPVVSNPNAVISPDSKMAAIGKTPSRYNANRQVAGIADWTQRISTPNDLERWQKEPDYGICIQTRHVRALDVDVDDPDEAAAINRFVAEQVGFRLPARWRRDAAKFLLAFTLPGEFTKRRFKTAHGMVEFLATGQQFIAAGTHPKGARYEWAPALPDSFPALPADAFEALWQALVDRFGVEEASTSSASVKREKLANAKHNDPVAQHLIDHDHVISEARDGRLHIVCPFEAEHTSESAESATTYWPAHTGGYVNGHFHCLHAHCEHRSDAEFKEAIGYVDETILADFEDLGRVDTGGAGLGSAESDGAGTTDPTPVGGQLEAPAKFAVQDAHAFAQGRRPEWIVKGVLPRGELIVLFGESGSGKSFVALDLSTAIAKGVAWRGRRTRAGRVAYVAAEGAGGFRNRLTAHEQFHDESLEGVPLGVIHAAPNLLEKSEALDLAKAVIAWGRADVIVVDTLAQTMPGGNENAGEDMGKVLAHCKGIHRATGATVVLIHHAGKDTTKGARGWSGLRAAADAELEVIRTDNGRVLRTSKQKDGEDGLEWGFNLETVQIGVDEDGDAVTSCVVVEAEIAKKGMRKLGAVEKLVCQVVGEISLAQTEGIEVKEVINATAKLMKAPEEGKRDTRKQMARRALLALCEGDEAPYLLENDCLSVL